MYRNIPVGWCNVYRVYPCTGRKLGKLIQLLWNEGRRSLWNSMRRENVLHFAPNTNLTCKSGCNLLNKIISNLIVTPSHCSKMKKDIYRSHVRPPLFLFRKFSRQYGFYNGFWLFLPFIYRKYYIRVAVVAREISFLLYLVLFYLLSKFQRFSLFICRLPGRQLRSVKYLNGTNTNTFINILVHFR